MYGIYPALEFVCLCAGPLGTGIANAVGIAATEAHLAARFNKADAPKVIDHYTYAAALTCARRNISVSTTRS